MASSLPVNQRAMMALCATIMDSDPMPNRMRPAIHHRQAGRPGHHGGARHHEGGEDHAGAADADAVDEQAAAQHREDGGEAVHGVHGADGGAVGVEDLDEGGLDGADAIVSEVAAEGHQGGEGQHQKAIGSAGSERKAGIGSGHGFFR